MGRKAPTVPLYVRIPPDLRARLDAQAAPDPARPWVTRRLQDIIIEALYLAFPDPAPASPPTPEPTTPAEPTPARTRKRAPTKRPRTRGRTTNRDASA